MIRHFKTIASLATALCVFNAFSFQATAAGVVSPCGIMIKRCTYSESNRHFDIKDDYAFIGDRPTAFPAVNAAIQFSLLDHIRDVKRQIQGDKDEYGAGLAETADGRHVDYVETSGYKVIFLTPQFVSVKETYDGCAGGTGWNEVKTVNCGLAPFKLLKLQDVLGTTNVYPAVAKLCRQKLSTYSEVEEFESSIDWKTALSPKNLECFTVDQGGIRIIFPKYAVACGAAGPQEVALSYRELKTAIPGLVPIVGKTKTSITEHSKTRNWTGPRSTN